VKIGDKDCTDLPFIQAAHPVPEGHGGRDDEFAMRWARYTPRLEPNKGSAHIAEMDYSRANGSEPLASCNIIEVS
jgi:hypothetical protein